MVQWLYENKKGIQYRDIESLEDNHECDYLGLKLIDIPLITSYGVLKWSIHKYFKITIDLAIEII